ncbi:MAG: DUF6816 family protein [Cyanobacteria bacterium P01_C01_bin.89]
MGRIGSVFGAIFAAIGLWIFCAAGAIAGSLGDRVAAFPDWTGPPPTRPAVGDLVYPQWMAGHWQINSTLVDLKAPLAPGIVTPGFEGNRELVDRPMEFMVKFVPRQSLPAVGLLGKGATRRSEAPAIVADRAYNGQQIAEAYLGPEFVKNVAADPATPNEQLVTLAGGRQLVSNVVERGSESPTTADFIATEVVQQTFQSPGENPVYLNTVETTNAYHYRPDEPYPITADQYSAIYLSPRDASYAVAKKQPVALYHYTLTFTSLPD